MPKVKTVKGPEQKSSTPQQKSSTHQYYGSKDRKKNSEQPTVNISGPVIIEIDTIKFTFICKSQQDDKPYTFPESETITPNSCDMKQQFLRQNESPSCDPSIFYNSRDMVCFTSSSHSVYLYAYRSSSELGIWRLAYLREGDCGMYKGMLDYVQGTLLHHKLIQFINENWDSIPLATDVIPQLIHQTQFSTPCYAYNIPDKQICLVPPFITQTEINDIDDNSRCKRIGHFNYLSTTCANQSYTSLSQIWGELMWFGNYLHDTKYFTIDSSTDINHHYSFVETYAGIKADITIKSVTIRNEHESYVLIYCVYTAKYNGKKVSGCYGIALLPSDSSVNKYGIYTSYISANIFICKPFFYDSMCNYDDTQIPELLCKKVYLYTGFIYECWPYTELFKKPFDYQNDTLKKIIDRLRFEAISIAEKRPTNFGFFGVSLSVLYRDIINNTTNALSRALTTGGKKSKKKRKTQRKTANKNTTKKRPYSIFKSNK